MMVTFISECEKKALPRTRRVLDAFANRIGERTWQTVITEEGLIAVKKLLRQTVTKNTAVACHWMRSRSRTELVWIVGNRRKFNAEGLVPVNTTEKELIMDVKSDHPIKGVLYANTHLQSLSEHSFAVGYVAEQIHKQIFPNRTNETTAVFIAGCLHDIGKLDPTFQSWTTNPKKKNFVSEDGYHIDDTKFSFEKYPRHNEISLLFYYLFDRENLKITLNSENKNAVKHAIYWHHAKPFRKEKNSFSTYSDIYSKLNYYLKDSELNGLLENGIKLLNKISDIDINYRIVDSSRLMDCFDQSINSERISSISSEAPPLPRYKAYEKQEKIEKYLPQIKKNAINNIMRSCLISADRLISGLTSDDLHNHIKNRTLDDLTNNFLSLESNLVSHIDECLKLFPNSERSKKQSEIAHQLVETRDIAVLSGAAGCGKTKIALEWAKLKRAQQIIWICPRVQVCQGLFYELTSILSSQNSLSNAKIEINTGEFKFTNEWGKLTIEDDLFQGDIVITTIDQIFSSITTHTKVDNLINYLNAHVVFDEFHEYITMPAFNFLFAELILCKKHKEIFANTLLVSATPHYFYLKEVLLVDKEDIIEMPSFNNSLYKIDFMVFDENKQDDTNPLYCIQNKNTIVISNTALTAQKSFIKNQHDENVVLLHSKFKKSDKQKWFSEVYESFKKNGLRKFNVLRSGPIVQASLNITCDYMVSEITNAENFLQRLGRLDRFGENEGINTYCIAVPEAIHQGKGVGNSARFLSRMFALGSTKAWYQMLQIKLEDQPIKLADLYILYKEFYEFDSNAYKLIESDLIAAFKSSVDLIDKKLIDPITILSKKTTEVGRTKISKSSLRGDNRFVQMAICDVNEFNNPKFINEYAYQIPVNEKNEIDSLTASINLIEGYGDSNKNLLAYMMKKHHYMMGGKKDFKDFILLNKARDQEFPIYLSYISNDLDHIGGESARYSEAIYYAVCDKQPIGVISIKDLINN